MCLYNNLPAYILFACNYDKENVIQAYLSGMLAPKCKIVAILSNHSTDFKNSH